MSPGWSDKEKDKGYAKSRTANEWIKAESPISNSNFSALKLDKLEQKCGAAFGVSLLCRMFYTFRPNMQPC